MFEADQGERFGKWGDEVSQFMYFDSTKEILSKIEIPELVADYGGGNGNLKKFIPHALTIDIDESKKPDRVESILEHRGEYDLVVIRFVLHYLSDNEIKELLKRIQSKHVLIIQFVNEDKKAKIENSRNEQKIFRNQKELELLLPAGFQEIYSKEYLVSPEFYRNRLGIGNYKKHRETLKAYYL